MYKLDRSFYEQPVLHLAKDLIGKYFCRRVHDELLVGRIVETEAYKGSEDPAAHSYRGKTERTSVMFGPAGHLYVYFTYGMHFCSNVVAEGEKGYAVLLRAVEPVTGIQTMRTLRERARHDHELTNGPAKLAQAFGIARAGNGIDLTGDEIFLCGGSALPKQKILCSPRIGISVAREKKWRFFIEGNEFVSKMPRAPRVK